MRAEYIEMTAAGVAFEEEAERAMKQAVEETEIDVSEEIEDDIGNSGIRADIAGRIEETRGMGWLKKCMTITLHGETTVSWTNFDGLVLDLFDNISIRAHLADEKILAGKDDIEYALDCLTRYREVIENYENSQNTRWMKKQGYITATHRM